MNKMTKKIVGKFGIFAPIALIVLIVGIVFTALFGWNVAPSYDAAKTVRISVNSTYTEARETELHIAAESVFDSKALQYDFVRTEEGATNNYSVVYSFSHSVDADMEEVCSLIREKIAEKTANVDGALYGLDDFIFVTGSEKTPLTVRSQHFILRAVIAAIVVLIVTFIYVALRHKIAAAFVAVCVAACSLLLTMSLVAIVRVPVSANCVNALIISLLFGVVYGTLVAGKLRATVRDKENAELSAKELVVKAAPEKLSAGVAASLAVALLLVGAMGTTPVQWLVLIALLGLVSSYFTAAILFPAVCPAFLEKVLASRAKKKRYDYKKEKKSKRKKSVQEVKAASEEQPVAAQESSDDSSSAEK